METNLLNPSAGLFWLSKDYTSITDINGLKEFTKDDVASGVLIQPIGGHYLHDFPRDIPRGRVELHGKKLKIYLGEDFPKENFASIKNQVIHLFKLDQYIDIIIPKYHYHWNLNC